MVIKTEIREPDAQAGMKSLQTIKIDTANRKATSAYKTGVTKFLGREFNSRGDDFNVTEKVSGEDGIYKLSADGTTGSKFLPADIDYAFNFTINEKTKELGVTGGHDGYPSYTIALDGTTLYDHQQGSRWDLRGDGDDVKVEFTKPY